MQRQTAHSALPVPTHDENARQNFVVAFRTHLTQKVGPGAVGAYKARVEDQLIDELGRPPKDSEEVRKGMTRDPLYQLWSAMQRQSQEMIWSSAMDTVERTLPTMRGQEQARAQSEGQRGSLRLDPALEIPRYHSVYDIHNQPGGYHTDFSDDDYAAGAIYDLGVPMYAMGMMGPENNSTGQTLVNCFQTVFADRKPERILDVGCAIGNSTVPWARAFPQAQVHGVDVAAPCLRYGHIRANALGVAIELSQQNAEATDFPDSSFDVIASALLFHETSRTAVPRILREMHRLLKPGGVMLHMDGFKTIEQEPLDAFIGEWEVYNNNEYFLKTLRQMDIIAEVERAGFDRDKIRFELTPFVSGAEITKPGTKGYMSGFREIRALIAEKSRGAAQ